MSDQAGTLSGSEVVRRISAELARNPSWKIIVRGNSWLCPYCGEIAARDLTSGEAIEGRIARHLIEDCYGFENFTGKLLDLDELRRKAKLFVFVLQVGRWILDDERYSLATDEGFWLDPYSGETTEITLPEGDPRDPLTYGEQPEHDPFLTEVALHFLQSESFERGQIMELDALQARLAEENRQSRKGQVRERFSSEPEWQLLTADRVWLCPFCANPTGVVFPSGGLNESFLAAVEAHVVDCDAYGALRGEPRPVDYLKKKVSQIVEERQVKSLLRKITDHPNWRCRDLLKRWYCPYCAERTELTYPDVKDEDDEKFKIFSSQVLGHCRRCNAYKEKAPIHSKQQMLEALQTANFKIKRNHELQRCFESSPLFTVAMEDRSWICPYCAEPVKDIEIDPEKSFLKDAERFEGMAEMVFEHLESCAAYRPGTPPSTRLEDLLAEARERSAELTATFMGVEAFESERERLRDEVANMVQSEDLDPETAREASLASARNSKLRQLPKLPEIPGFEFAAEYRACQEVGGDFYDFFQVNDQVLGVAIGDLSGRGVQATMNLGLARKVLQIHGRRQRSCTEVLTFSNEDIFNDLDEDTTLDVFFGFLNLQSRAFQFARAGHKAPLIVYNERREPKLNLFQTRGISLGRDAGQVFRQNLEQMNLQLAPGDVVLQFTDGVVEAVGPDRQPFGFERLKELVARHAKDEVEYLLWKVRRAVERFTGEDLLQDDLTLIAFKIL